MIRKLAALATLAVAGTAHARKGVALHEWLDAFELLPSMPTKQEVAVPQKALLQDMNCTQAIDQLLLNAVNFDFGSIFYVLLNGWYLGAWGDYGSCVADATFGQYIMVKMEGNYDQKNQAIFTRGGLGKYHKFSTFVGMCVPYQCKESDMASMDSHYIAMAEGANWTDVSVSYRFSSRDDQAVAAAPKSPWLSVMLFFLLGMIGLGAIGTIIEMTHIGDIPNLDYARLVPASKFVSIKQYEPILIQRKRPWAQFALVFSMLRNFMQLSKQPRAYQVAQNPGMANNPQTVQYTKYMKIFNGIMGMSLVYSIWGSTYFFSWYGVYDNPQDITKLRGTWAFTLIPAAFFAAPLMFFVQGFVCTFSLLANKPDGEKLTISELSWFLLKRIAKVTPIHLFMLGWAFLLGPTMTNGPYWDMYSKAMAGCSNGYWWTNLVFVNNFYPANFDEKCMGWTWFLACYIQLSLLLPLLLAIHQWLPRKVSTGVFATLFIAFFAANAFIVKNHATGIFLRFDDDYYFNTEFYAQVFMRPYFHFNAYLWGVVLSIAYLRYVKERAGAADITRGSMFSRMFEFARQNGSSRYPMYIVGFAIMVLCVFGIHGYIADNSSWSAGKQAVYASLAYPGFVFACSLMIMPALLGRAEFIRFFFGGDIWTLFRSVALPVYLYAPQYALSFFLGMSTAQHLDYQMMFYNFCGIFIFSLIFGQIFCVFIERPFLAMFHLKHDITMVTSQLNLNPDYFNIERYKIGATLMGAEQVASEGNTYLPPTKNLRDPFASDPNVMQANASNENKSTNMFDFSNSAGK